MKEALSLRKQSKQVTVLPRKGRGQHGVPGLPSRGSNSKALKLLLQVDNYSNVNPERWTASFWKVKKKI